MKPADEIRALLKNAGIRTSAARDESVLADALRAGGLNRDNRPARCEPSVWRAIMRSRTTKLASAAVIVAAIIISLSHFNQPVVKAVELSEIAKAMQQATWEHRVASFFGPYWAGVDEEWIGFESKIHAMRLSSGKVIFASERDHKRFEYDPNVGTITVSFEETPPIDITSPETLTASMGKLVERQGGKTTVRLGEYEGHKVQIQEMVFLGQRNPIVESPTMILYLDPESKRLYASEVKGCDSTGKVVMGEHATYDYPQTGPQSIYDLGVPRDARVVDLWTQPTESAVLESYGIRRKQATNEYVSIVTYSTPEGIVTSVCVDYRAGGKQQMESHAVSDPGEQLGSTFESLLAWTRTHFNSSGRVSIHLYDGRYEWRASRDPNGNWTKSGGQSIPETDYYLYDQSSLRDLGWPRSLDGLRIIDDAYAKERGLICLESLQQGYVRGSEVTLPRRVVQYLNPAHDYLCQKLINEVRPDASWQQDKNWLAGVDPSRVGKASLSVREVTDAVQASNGRWYPRVIVSSGKDPVKDPQAAPLQVRWIYTVYVEPSLKFPPQIFDPNTLPGR